MYIIVVFFFFLVNISMAEMASMAPTAGGQYHWISEFAPPSAQKILSYFMGWLCVLGWQSGVAIGSFLAATEIQGLIVLNNDSYVYERWHGTLLTIAVVAFVAVFNTFLAKHLPLVEGIILCLNLCGFVAILVPLWVLGPKSDSKQVWTQFEDGGNWGSLGLATLVGLITPTTAFLGADAAVHMAEELKDAAKVLPRAMIATSVVNGILGFVMLVTFCYTLGDLTADLTSPTGYPFIQVFYNATGSKGGATAMSVILILSAIANAMTNMATASRQLFAFARDEGVPFAGWFQRFPKGWEIPLNCKCSCWTTIHKTTH
jgi:choline transport protein